MRRRIIIAILLLVIPSFACNLRAQGFDDLKKAPTCKLDTKLKALVDANDVRGLERLLKSNPEMRNAGSNTGRNDRGAANVIPLVNDVVGRVLNGDAPIEMCKSVFAAGCDPYSVYNGKTPIYQVVDVLVKTPSVNTGRAKAILDILVSTDNFDINRRYRSLPPPFSYMLSENYSYLGGSYSQEYLDEETIFKFLSSGAVLNTYDENGASLLLLANTTGNIKLRDYLVNHGVNISKVADDSGNNAVFAAIESNDVEHFRTIVNNYHVRLTASEVRDRISGMSKEMYNYVSERCALDAESYSELVDFREIFSDKRKLVQSKYEDMARKETAVAYDFESITLCRQRFPDLNTITEPRRRSIAEKEFSAARTFDEYDMCRSHYPDYSDLNAVCRSKVASAELIHATDIPSIKEYEKHYPDLAADCAARKLSLYNASAGTLKSEYEKAKSDVQAQRLSLPSLSFSDFISDFENYYDPEGLVPVAKAMNKYYQIVNDLLSASGTYYCADDSYLKRIRDDARKLASHITESSSIEKFGLSSIWLDDLCRKKSNMLERHADECSEIIRKIDNMRYRDLPSGLVVNSYNKDHYVSYESFRFIVTDFSDTETDHYFYVVRGMQNGKLMPFIRGYVTLEDAIIAGYCAAQYGFGRNTGSPGYDRGIIGSLLDSAQRRLDLENARQMDVRDEAIDSWFK